MPDIAGNSLDTATLLNLGSSVQILPDTVTPTFNDYYRFTLSNRSSFNLSLTGLTGNTNVTLLDGAGNPLSISGVPQVSANPGTFSESINTALDAGTYYIRVSPGSGVTTADYTLGVSTSNQLSTDILWRNYVTGQNSVWFMNGTTYSTFAFLREASDVNWEIRGTGDFNRDGQTDILWRNQTNGQNSVWFMNGTTYSTFAFLLDAPDLNWEIGGTGDFNQDGQVDILWRNYATGQNSVWFMNGTTRSTFAFLLDAPDLNWEIVGTGDFNQDGQVDILWRNYVNGQNSVWLMNGTTRSTFAFLVDAPDVNWEVSGTGDFNQDGQVDILWRNYVNGQNSVWLMNGTTRSTFVFLEPATDVNWRSLAPFIRTNEPTPIDIAGNSPAAAFDLGSNLTGNSVYRDQVSNADLNDYYRFNLGAASGISLSLANLTADLDLQLFSGDGTTVLQSSTLTGVTAESIISTLTAGTYYLRVYPTGGASSTYTLNLSINNLPVLATISSLVVSEGTSAAIASSLLRVTDNDNTPDQLVYTLGALPNWGTLLLNGTTLSAGSTFTQADLDNGTRLRYQHDGSETTADNFTFTVSDSAGGTITSTTFSVAVTPVNDPPVLVSNNPLSLSEGATANLTNLFLRVTDVDNTAGQVRYVLDDTPDNGTLQLSGVNLTAGNSFTQDDINNGRIRYVHNGSETTTDNFSFNVADGAGGAIASTTFTLAITPVNDEPGIATNNQLTLSEGTFANLTGSLLRVTDNDNLPAEVRYTLSNLPTNGTLLFNGTVLAVGSTFTQADVDNGTRLRYQHNGSETLTDNFSFTVSDGLSGGIGLTTFSVAVTPVNDPPVLVSNNPLSLSEGATANLTNLFLRVTDVDNTAGQVRYVLDDTPDNGTLQLSGVNLTAGNSFTQDDINNGRIRYVHNGSETTTDNFSFNVADGAGGAIASTTFTLAITPVNDPPVLATNAPLTVTEGTFANLTNTLLQVTDNDNLPTELRYTLNNLPASGTLLLNGASLSIGSTFTQADIDNGTLLRYQHNGSETLTDTFSFSVADGVGGNLGLRTFTIAVAPVNDPPVLTLPTDSQSVDQGTSVAIFGIAIADPDANPGQVTVTVSADNGLLSLATVNDLTFVQGTGTQNQTIVFTGTVTAVNNALAALIYRSNATFVGQDTININVNDNGNTGSGGPQADSDTIRVNVTAVNRPPVITLPTTPTALEDTNLTISGISIGDVDAGTGNTTVSLSVANGVVSLGATSGLTFLNGTSAQGKTIVFAAPLALVNAALGNLVYLGDRNYNGSDSLTISVNDSVSAGASGIPLSDTRTLNITVNPVNDAPALTLPATQTANENTDLRITGISIADVDAGSNNVTVSVSAASGTLSLSSTTGLIFATGNGIQNNSMVFSGSLAAVNNALAGLTYRGNTNFNGTDTVSIGVTDNGNSGAGIPLSANGAIAINVLGTNSAPIITVPLAPATNAGVDLAITGVGINDPDVGGNNLRVTIAAANGVLSLPTTELILLQGDGTRDQRLTFEGTLAAINSALAGLVYRSNPGFTGFENITISVNDLGNSGIGTPLSDTRILLVNVGGASNTLPIAANDVYTITRNGFLNVAAGSGVLVNDTDADGNPLSANLLTSTTNGTLVFNGNGSFTYNPNPGFVGIDSFTYRASDGIGNSNTSTVNITVTVPLNTAPVANPDIFVTNEDAPLFGSSVLGNDGDTDGNLPLTAQQVNGPANAASFTLNTDGSFTYVPTANFSGSDSFTYVARDSLGAVSNTATVNLVINAVNDGPTTVAESFSLTEDGTLDTGNVLSNDTDPEGNSPLSAQLTRGPSRAQSFVLNNDGSFTYIPAVNFNGTDSFVYVARDALGASSSPTTVFLTINPVNDAPTAVANNFTVLENGTLNTGNVLTNDTDPENNLPLTAQIIGNPTNAQSFVLNSNGSFTYIPTANFNGTDRFTYVASDSLGAVSNTATVNITVTSVNNAPVAVADSFTLNEDTVFNTGNVLANDTDADDPGRTLPLLAQIIGNPTNAQSFTLSSDGSFTYTPTANFNGTDSFTYIARDVLGAVSNTATVNLTVNSVNDAPTAVANNFLMLEGGTLNTENVLTNDTDIENNLPLTAQIIGNPTNAQSFVLNSDGSFTYIPTATFNGTDSFTYVARDALGAISNTATVNITITSVNNAPVAVADSVTLNEDTVFNTGNVLANDTDADDPGRTLPLTAQIIGDPTNAQSFTLSSDGSFTYTPTANFNGTDSFTYIARDALGAISNTATVVLTINPVNDAPIGVADSVTLNEDSTFATGNVLTNDTDVDDPGRTLPLTAQIGANPTNALSFTLSSDGSFTYTPTANFNGTDSFTYVAVDGSGAASGTTTVALTVNPVNDAPVAVNDTFTVTAGGTLTGSNVLTNDTDIDNPAPQTATLVAGPANAQTFGLNADGTFIYAPTAGTTTDSFTYVAVDPAGLASNTATVVINVGSAPNLAPTAQPDTFTLNEDATFTNTVLGNDGDPDGNLPLTVQLVGNAPTNAQSFTLNSDGTFSYTPIANFNGTDTFSYVISDSLGAASNTAIVSLTVNPVNDAPVAVNDTFTVTAGGTLTGSNVLTNDTDIDNPAPQTATLVAGPANAQTFGLNADGTFIYAPTAGTTTDSFTYVAVDPAGLASNTATVVINVGSAPNLAPTAQPDTFTLNEDATFTNTVLGNDGDPDGNLPLTVQLVGNAPTNAQSFTLNSDGTFTYTPIANFNGTDTFSYVISDSLGAASNTAIVSLTVNPVNDAPVAVNDTFTVTAGGTLTGSNVLTNDTDIDNPAPQTATLVAGPANAQTFGLNADGTFIYAPTAGTTTDSFTYVAVDPAGLASNTATVVINVGSAPNLAPTAQPDTFTLNEDATFTNTVLGNDGDPDGNLPLTVQLVGNAPTNAQSFTLNSDGTFSYTPIANFNGTDTFSYVISDSLGAASNTAIVSLTINPVNDAPIGVADSVTLNEDSTFTTGNVLTNDTDVDDPGRTLPLTAQIGANPTNALSFTLSSDGSFTYTPTANFNGTDSFTYVAVDGSGAASGTTTVALTVNPVNDAPVAVNDTVTVLAGGTLTGSNVLTNDTDIDNPAPQTATLVAGPANAQTFGLNADGTFIYAPTAGTTTDSFTYVAVDPAGLASNTATVVINVSSTNLPPTAQPDTFTLNEDATFTNTVLGNDGDPDGNLPLTVQLVGNAPTNAQSFTLNSDGTFTYTPIANFNGTDTFSYVISDSLGAASNTAIVSLTINPVNDGPTAAPDVFALDEDSVFTGNVLDNDSDPENNIPLTAQVVSNPSNFQSFTLNADGSFTYVPTRDFNGNDGFVYVVRDALGASSTATVSLAIAPINDAPIANSNSYRAVIDTPRTVTTAFGVLDNDTDIESEPLTAIAGVRTTTGGGTVTLNTDGSFVYTPAPGFSGADTFTYQATDSITPSAPGTVTLTVGTNAAPIGVADVNYRALPAVATTFSSFQGVLGNDIDTDGDLITAIAGVRTSANGATVTLDATGAFIYRPAAGFIGADTFTYQATDGFTVSSPTTVSITVSDNTPPLASDDTGYQTAADSPLTVNALASVLSNDTDPDGGTLTAVTGVRNTSGNGTVTLNADGSFIYTPRLGFLGTDTFIYQATDGTDVSNPATVSISVVVNTPPTAVGDLYQVPPNNPFTVASTFGVLLNDTDAEGNNLTAVPGVRATTAGGTVTLSTNGSFVYTPVAGFTGLDTFTYIANDGTNNSNPATVTLSVFVNTPPIANNDLFNTNVNRSIAVTAPGVLSNDSDPDGNPIQAFLVTSTSNGTLNLLPNGSFTYVPNTGFTGNDIFSYRVNDGFVDTFATATISVSPNQAPVANADTYSVNRNNVLVVPYTAGTTTIAGVLSNDVDTEPLTASIVTGPGQGNVLLNPDGTFTYTPFSGIGGLNDTFVYRASDGTLSSTATVTITIRNSSTAPIATGETFSISANTTLSVGAAQNLLQNDSDPDGDRLTVRLTQNPANGTVTLNPDGTFTYVPNTNFTSIDTFTYVANDGIVDSNPVTVSITVGAVNSPPTVNLPGSQVGFRNADLVIASGLRITDPDAGNNPVRLTMTVTNGSLNLSTTNGLNVIDAPGDTSVVVEGSLANINTALTNLVYSPNLNYAGPDQIAISVSDLGNTGATGGIQTAAGVISLNVSSGAIQVADINQTSEPGETDTLSSSPTNLAAVGDTVYFAADDGLEGVELWRSDGTEAGTTLVANINTAVGGSSSPSNLTVVGNNLFFAANNSTSGVELFKTDLTTGATSLVKNIRALSGSSNPTNLVNFNNTLFFRANDGTGTALWRSDGTDAGTVKVGTGYTLPSSLTVVGNTLYFTASNGTELWRTDGTNGGTVRVSTLGASNAANLIAVGNTLFFTATDATNGSELWRSDGTAAGTTRISDINAGTGDAVPNNLVSLGNALYFFASNGTSVGLYQSTAAGVVSLVQTLPSTGQLPTSLTVVGNNLFFRVDSGTLVSPDIQLWKSDGTTAGTGLVRDINPLGNDQIAALTNVNGSLFFTANDGLTRIWATDGTATGTVPVSGSFTTSLPTNLTPVGTRLFFTAETPTTGTELWVL